MKRWMTCLAVLLLLGGCDAAPNEPAETLPAETAPVETEAPETKPEAVQPITAVPQPETVQETLTAGAYYRAHLLELLEGKQAAPAETDAAEADTTEAAIPTEESTGETAAPTEPVPEQKQFAVLDIDGDGREELLVLLTDAEGVTEYILDNTGEELWLSSAAVFYANGAVETVSSGEVETFTPYMLYQYDAERDVYYEVAYVDVLDLKALEEAGLADEYPEDIDVSESGRVYLIGSGNPVDAQEYELWCSTWRTEPMDIAFVELTKENIDTIHD